MTTYSIYKKNQSVTPKEAVNVHDLGYLGVEKDFPEQRPLLPCTKRKIKSYLQKKRIQQKLFYKENGDRAYHIQVEKYKIMIDVFRTRLRKYNGIC